MPKKKNTVRADGRISVQVYLGRDEDGKRKYKTVYGMTQKEADEKALQVKLAMRKGLDITSELDPFETWANRWIELKETQVSPGMLASYECALKHIVAHLGSAPISKIRTADIQKVITVLAKRNPNTGKPTSVKTLRSISSTAGQVFQMAIENRIMDYNPATALIIPKLVAPSKRRALTSEEQNWVETLPHRAQRAAMIMMLAGLRRGEVIPLTWNDIDLDNKTLTVNKTVGLVKGHFIIKASAKTELSLRVIDMPQKLVNFLRNEKRVGLIVCVNAKNEMHTESSWSRMWESYLSDLNLAFGQFDLIRKKNGEAYKSKYDPDGVPMVIPPFTPHWLRHTFATNLYLAGVDPATAKEQLGHSDITTTLGIYTHLDATYKRKSMDKLDAYLSGCKSDASQENRK